jgi:hypothetical protein
MMSLDSRVPATLFCCISIRTTSSKIKNYLKTAAQHPDAIKPVGFVPEFGRIRRRRRTGLSALIDFEKLAGKAGFASQNLFRFYPLRGPAAGAEPFLGNRTLDLFKNPVGSLTSLPKNAYF